MSVRKIAQIMRDEEPVETYWDVTITSRQAYPDTGLCSEKE